jgi:hypothetical protein
VDVGLLPRFPCPVLVVVVVWQLLLSQFPTGVGPDVQTLVPLSLVKVPPAASHVVCEGDAASAAVVPKANNDIDPSNIKDIRDIVLLLVLLLGLRAKMRFFSCAERSRTRADHISIRQEGHTTKDVAVFNK